MFQSRLLQEKQSRSVFFISTNRIVKSKTAMAALEQAYKNTIMVGRFLLVCIIELNPAQVDVTFIRLKQRSGLLMKSRYLTLFITQLKQQLKMTEPLKRLSLKKIRFIGKSLKTFIKIMIINRFRRNLISLKEGRAALSAGYRLSREKIFGRLKRRSLNINCKR